MLDIIKTASRCTDEVEVYHEVELLFMRYDRLKTTASVEGLASTVSSIVTGLVDITLNAITNIRITLKGLFKDVKRSELQAYFHSHTTRVRKLNEIGYTSINKVKIPFYSFKDSPNTMAAYCVDTFKLLNMRSRMNKLIDEYSMLAACLRTEDINKAANHITQLNALNSITLSEGILTKLSGTVITRPDANTVMVGKVFNSVGEISQAVDTTLRCSEELNAALSVEKLLDPLYNQYEKIAKALLDNKDAGVDISKLSRLGIVIRDTGKLIEHYAVLVKEYISLEHFLVNVLHACL